MIKRLLFSAMAVAAMAFSASADTYSLMTGFGGSGWGSSYDAATKTITYEGEWKGCGIWLGDFDASSYDEVVFECEATEMAFNLVIEYTGADNADNPSVNFPAGSTKAVVPLSETLKKNLQQVYVQAATAGTIVVKDLYLQNAVEVDPTIPVVIFEGEKVLDWSTSLDISTNDLVMAKFAAGDKLVFEYTAGESNGFKILYKNPSWAWTLLPLMTGLEGFNEQYETIWLNPEEHEYAVTFPAEDVEILLSSENHGGLVQGDGITLTKISVVHAAAAAEASNWYISGELNGWDNGKSADYAFKTTATEGVYEFKCDELSGEFLIVWAENGEPDWSKKIAGVSNMEPGTAYPYVEGGNNCSVSDLLKNVTVILDTNSKTLQVNGTAAANEFDTVYLIGDFGDGWSETITNKPLTLKEGTTDTYVGEYALAAETSYFKFKAGSFIFGTGGANVAVDLDTDYTATKGGDAFAIGKGIYKFECKVAADGQSATFTVTDATDGITDINADENAPVEFFNLQGVRVAEPANGLYIRRQGGKATKVYVK